MGAGAGAVAVGEEETHFCVFFCEGWKGVERVDGGFG